MAMPEDAVPTPSVKGKWDWDYERAEHECSQVLPNLYLTDRTTAFDAPTLDRLGISHIVSALDVHELPYPKTRKDIKRLQISIPDDPSSNLSVHFETATAFIKEALAFDQGATEEVVTVKVSDTIESSESGEPVIGLDVDATPSQNAVLVHCFAGISRSPTLVCAYLIAAKGMSALDSVTFVRTKRWIIKPNPGFVKQLSSWEALVAASATEGQPVSAQ